MNDAEERRALYQEQQAEFEQKQAEELAGIPEEFHSPIRSLAWDLGHAYGFNEVLIHVSDLCDQLAPAIAAYGKRVRESQSSSGGGG